MINHLWSAVRAARHAPRLITVVGCILIAAVHLATLTISPTPWQDEVQIVDLGRTVLSPDPEWALNWASTQRPVLSLNYLGPLVQEFAYRSFAPSIAGARLSTLLGAAVATALLLAWLRLRGVARPPALALAAVFFLDPIFVQGYRGARVDCWAIALALASCVLVRRSGRSSDGRASQLGQIALSAGLLVVAFFVWPSAVYLIPLVAAEACEVHGRLGLPARRLTQLGGATAAGAVAGLVLCVVPMGAHLSVVIGDLLYATGQFYHPQSPTARVTTAILSLGVVYQLSPWLPLLALIAVRRNWIAATATALTLAAMTPTHIYVHRVVYLLPYWIVLASGMWQGAPTGRYRTWLKAGLAVVLAWAAGVSLLVRPGQALLYRSARDHQHYERAAAQLSALPHSRVYLGAWDFYYAGRQQHWKMVRAYGDIGVEARRQMFLTLDYALVNAAEPQYPSFVADMGWHQVTAFELPPVSGLWSPSAPRRYLLYSRLPP